MSFSCAKHGWNHIYNRCPSCSEFVVTTGSSSGNAIKLWQDKLDEALGFAYRMEVLLREVSDNPDDYIKHHDKASQWLSEVRRVLTK